MKWEKTTQKGQFGNVTVRKSGAFVIRSTGSVFFIYKNGKQIGMTNKLRDATAFVELYNERGKTMAEKEYIEREALLQDIAETVIVSAKTGYTNPELKGINKVIGRIQAMPTADVQEVVRCKDCKKFCSYLSFCADNCIGAFGHCQITHMNVSPDFYCGYGEKNDKE